ncbi:MAG: Hsp20/alpha crystallin family protein, partial [Gammaproteobacteria bacterium]
LPAEVRESDDRVEVRLEVPGMEAADFDIAVLGNALHVRGVKRVETESVQGRYHVLECAYGEFERVIPLPAEVDEARAQARYRRGVLHLRLPKLHRGPQVRIPVEG